MEQFILILELLGTAAFSVSGAMAAIHRRLDLFGVLFCACITALGGGVLRDLLLGLLPPKMFTNYLYLVIAAAAALTTFFAVKRAIQAEKSSRTVFLIGFFFDTVGLCAFTIVGMNIAISCGHRDNPFFVIFLGMTTGCGGGILRDILLRRIPLVFSKHVYAVASILGGIAYMLLLALTGLSDAAAMEISMALIFLIRSLAAYFRWNLPKAV